ncbi:MAG: hypothetical protein ACK5M7_21250 [Draconibacterium sp.]
MKASSKFYLLILFLFGLYGAQPLWAQTTNKQLIVTKQSNGKQKILNTNAFFKLKTNDGEKVKGNFSAFTSEGFVTEKNDTLLFQDIRWLRVQRELNKLEKGLAIAGVFMGAYLSIGAIPAGLYFLFIESTPWVLLAPVATLSSFVVGFRTLRGKKYRTGQWQLSVR